MSIIIEGPDGAGKTTLITDLFEDFPGQLERHPRFATSLGGPHRDLADLVFADRDQLQKPDWVYDRHPCFSEYIYAHEIEGREVDHSFFHSSMKLLHQDIQDYSLVIFCLPPFWRVRANVERDPHGQMEGVQDNLADIHEAYQTRAATYLGNSVVYDYTRPTSYMAVRSHVRRHLSGVPHVHQ